MLAQLRRSLRPPEKELKSDNLIAHGSNGFLFRLSDLSEKCFSFGFHVSSIYTKKRLF
jgi:hypothetical protein